MKTTRRKIAQIAGTVLALVLLLGVAMPAFAQGPDGSRGPAGEQIISEMGILLLNVEEGGPAEAAGLQSGDIVLVINGVRVESLRPMWRVLRGTEPGDLMTLVVKSGSEVKIVPLVVGQRPGGRAYFGVTPIPVFGQRSTVDEIVGAQQSGSSESADCSSSMRWALLVTDIAPGGPTDLAGLVPGDVVVAINGVPLPDEEYIHDFVRSYSPGETVSLEVYSQGDAPGEESHLAELTFEAQPDDPNMVYWGARVAELQYVVTDCGTSGGSVTVDAVPVLTEAVPAVPVVGANPWTGEMPVDPSALVPPPDDMVCTSEQTWGFGVTEVLPGGPAEQAGIRANDAIVEINGEPIPAGVQAESLLAAYAPGDVVTLHVIQPFDPATGADAPGDVEIDVTLGEHPNVAGRAYLGVMGMPVIMGETTTCSGSAPAEAMPEPDQSANPEGSASSEGSGDAAGNVTATVRPAPVPEVRAGDVTTPPAVVTATAMTTGTFVTADGLWIWCPLTDGVYTCEWPDALDAPIIIGAEGGMMPLPSVPPAISGGALISGTEVLPAMVLPQPEVPLYCWTGQGFSLCRVPGAPVLPQPRTDDDQ